MNYLEDQLGTLERSFLKYWRMSACNSEPFEKRKMNNDDKRSGSLDDLGIDVFYMTI